MKKIFLIAVLVSKLFDVHAQNVGIGVINPTRAKLEVHGVAGNGATSAIFGGESTGISLQRNWPGIGFNQYHNGANRYIANGFAAVQFVDPNTGYMAFDMFGNGVANSIPSSSRRAMVIANEGRVTIGSGDYPPATLYVARGTAVDGTAVFQGTTHRSHFNYGDNESTHIRAGKNNGTVFINDIPGSKVVISGPVGINSNNPIFPLEVRQNVPDVSAIVMIDGINYNSWGFLISVGTGDLWLSCNGLGKGIFNRSSGQYSAISDKRLKTNIQQLPSLLGKVMQLQPVTYDLVDKNPNNKKNIGFIAQDVKNLFPELVTVSADTSHGYKGISDLHTMNYSNLGVIAIKVVQEQQQIIDSQQRSIQRQQEELSEMKKVLSGLLAQSKSNKK